VTRCGLVAAVCALAVVAGALAVRANAAPGLLVGVDDDTVKWIVRPNGLVATDRDLGLDAVRVTIPWRGGTSPTPLVGTYLHRVAMMVGLGQRVVLAVYGKPSDAPVNARQRAQYCGFVHHVLARIPIRDVVIWNEVNSPAYWPASAGAPAYEALLATCWDRLHALRPDVNLISSTAAHYDPAGFVRALGGAYRASGRTRPIVDTFGHNPYPDHASEPPWQLHPDTATVGQGDLGRLLAAFRDGFGGTAQPLPGTRATAIWYLEDGFQTTIADGKRRYYNGTENDRLVVPPVAPSGSGAQRARRDQALQLREALLLAYCQPAVGAFFNFELMDESRLVGWQSGLLWRDGTHKPSYGAFKATVALIKSGAVDCSNVPGV